MGGGDRIPVASLIAVAAAALVTGSWRRRAAASHHGPMTSPERSPADLPDDAGGDPACWMHRVCDACGRLADEDPPTTCPGCGAALEP